MKQSLIAALILSGCALDELDDDLGEVSQGVESPNKLAANKLAANKLAANALSAKTLSAANLASSSLLNTADGREVLTYLASCALAANDSFIARASDGITYSFPGSIGLAPNWKSNKLDLAKQRWVTACMLARTNAFGVQIQISMRGALGPLGSDASETGAFATVEGGFWGNLFAAGGPQMFACSSPIKARDAQVSTLPQRECASTDDGVTTPCGFRWIGLCQNPNRLVCDDTTPNYDRCYTSTSGERLHEVITVYLAGAYQ